MDTVKVRTNYQQARWDEPSIVERSTPGRRGGCHPPEEELVEAVGDVAANLLERGKARLPELDENGPLPAPPGPGDPGANLCNDISVAPAMKYNPRINEELASCPASPPPSLGMKIPFRDAPDVL